MRLIPASSELAANAGIGPEGHKRTSSVDFGASSEATMVACDINGIDVADLGAVDGCHKLVATEEALTSPPECFLERAAGSLDPVAHAAKRGRVSTDTASGAPALATTTNAAGSPTAAAPITESVNTATALAVADPNADAPSKPDEASDVGYYEAAPERSTLAAAGRGAAAAAHASSAAPDVVIASGTPAPGSSAIIEHHALTPASALTTAGVASASTTTAAACESDTIVANETSRGDAGCPETPIVSRRSHAVAIRPFSIGRTSTPAPVTLAASGCKSAVIVANATSPVHAQCPSTPVVSRLRVPRSHVIAGGAVGAVPSVQISALRVGRRSSPASTAALTVLPAPATTTAPTPAPAAPPMSATALGHVGIAGSRVPPQSSLALRTVSRVIRRGMGVIRKALVALFSSDMEATERQRSTAPGPRDEDARWDAGAPVDAALLGLRKRERHRFL